MKYIKLFKSEEDYKKSYASLSYPNISCVKSESSGTTTSRHLEQKKEGQPSNEIWYTQWDSGVSETFSVLYRKNSPLQWPFYKVSNGYFGADLETLEDGSDYDIYEGDKRVLKFKENPTKIGLIKDASGVTRDYGRYGWEKIITYSDETWNADYDGGDDWYYTRVKTMSLPDTIETIGTNAFRSCWLMEDIKLPSSLKEIGKYAFLSCYCLSAITIPETVETIGEEAFSLQFHALMELLLCHDIRYGAQYYYDIIQGRKGLISAYVPDSVTSMGDAVFEKLSALKSSKLSRSLTRIPKRTYKECSSLSDFTINDNVTIIDDEAFSGCKSLSAITLPETLTYVGGGAFCGCYSLTDVSIPSSLAQISDSMFESCSSLTNVHITSGTTSFGNYSFSNCKSLTSMGFIPNSVTKMGKGVFSGCDSLTSLDSFPTWMPKIVNGTFMNCKGLTSVKVPDWVTYIDIHAFDGCSNLTDITIPSGITTLPGFFLANCDSLSAYTVPEQITSIQLGAFYNCINLSTINLNHNENLSIGDSLNVGEGKGVFENCVSLQEITIPSTLKSIQVSGYGNIFKGCTGLKRVNIEGEDKNKFGDAFVGLDFEIKGEHMLYHAPLYQERIEVSSAITEIASYAFASNTDVRNIILGKQVTRIDQGAFMNCSKLERLSILNSGTTFFANSSYGDRYGIFYGVPCEVYNTYIYYYAGRTKDVVVNYGIEKIDKEAFCDYNMNRYMVAPNSVILPDTLKCIDNKAFWGSNITSIKFNATEEEILAASGYTGSKVKECKKSDSLILGTSCFEGCGYLQHVDGLEVPSNTTYIGDKAFCGCRTLTSVTIPEGVEYLGSYAFDDCGNIRELNINTHKINQISPFAFRDCINIPSVTIPNSVTKIYNEAFQRCYALKEINFESGSSLTLIAEDAFCGSGLKTITLPDSVTEIYSNAFINCKSLEYVNLGNGLVTFYPGAFAGCSNLKRIYIPGSWKKVAYVGFSRYKVFEGCYNLTDMDFGGTIDECTNGGIHSIHDYLAYLGFSYLRYIHCTDGDIRITPTDLGSETPTAPEAGPQQHES